MKIRKSASLLLGCGYRPIARATELLPPSPKLVPCLAPLGSHGEDGFLSPAAASKDLCGLNLNPWDLLDNLSLSDPEVVDDILDSYSIKTDYPACRLFSSIMPATFMNKEKQDMAMVGKDNSHVEVSKKTEMKEETSKKAAMKKENKEGKGKKKAKVNKEEDENGTEHALKFKKNDGWGWHCPRTSSSPNSFSEYLSKQKRSYLNPEFCSTMVAAPTVASKPSCNSKARKKRPTNDFNTTGGVYYYYTGFQPSQSKRHFRSTTHDSAYLDPKQEEVGKKLPKDASPMSQAEVETDDDGTSDGDAACEDVPSSGDDIPGKDDYYNQNSSGHSNGNMKRKKNPLRCRRKPVKARSLNSML
ncbi:hypothetical protein BS78_08G041500 [Paspalum vaginatum]|nr:hypothetical protein BS78_08G041500 [Paspalum vaginatum]